jgi:hypothetical protein
MSAGMRYSNTKHGKGHADHWEGQAGFGWLFIVSVTGSRIFTRCQLQRIRVDMTLRFQKSESWKLEVQRIRVDMTLYIGTAKDSWYKVG